ncbi:hypothetical protein GCM10011413_41980 [Pedobacter psychrotolerans]|uniref:Uncharacterized protein n=1 Tax=Pedobacter psychrotolerans TaxID=1843235 RepID=A0ABQ1T096_9SPHI|nr:hypothetical protein GCM10011413_41980 [Pedobacter psychrotolerans]
MALELYNDDKLMISKKKLRIISVFYAERVAKIMPLAYQKTDFLMCITFNKVIFAM